MFKNTSQAYGIVSKFLHWSMAFLLTVLFIMGTYMTGLDYYDPLYHSLPWWHRSLGLLLFALWTIRLLWRLTTLQPAALSSHSPWEKVLATCIQGLFYLFMLGLVISGYLVATAQEKGIDFFGWFTLPALAPKLNETIVDLLGETHEIMATTLAILVLLHALAAIKHHF